MSLLRILICLTPILVLADSLTVRAALILSTAEIVVVQPASAGAGWSDSESVANLARPLPGRLPDLPRQVLAADSQGPQGAGCCEDGSSDRSSEGCSALDGSRTGFARACRRLTDKEDWLAASESPGRVFRPPRA
jgi:hypothetical protein